uniref:gamma-glutamylcyclotransferase n=1 Tax=Riptortus pedestris TaxID=329032 RepID=R4WJD8_RIPPE|nr:conserved hypothetical protein [Riptortus pedestris]
MTGKFRYFAYGSNLLEKRIHINNPTAKRVSIGKLQNFRLDFNYWSERWGGNAATVVPDDNECVWGAIWDIDNSNMADLDRQEGVDAGVYKVINVNVEDPSGANMTCRSYQLCSLPTYSPQLPSSRYPSKIYLDTIIKGAVESKLPNDYIEKLRNIPHNNFSGPVNFEIN